MLIFQKFVTIAKLMNPNYVSMIFLSRWFTGGRGLDEFRKEMLNDDRLRTIVDFVDSTDCFPTVDIAGGINYILWDKKYHGLCDFTSIHKGNVSKAMRKLNEYETFIRRNGALNIVRKVVSRKGAMMSETVSGQTPFGFITTFKGKPNPFEGSIKLLGSNGTVTYVSSSEVTKNNKWIDCFKVIFTKASPGGGSSDKNGQYLLLSSSQVLKPYEVCTQTFLVGYITKNQEAAINCLHYLRTRFVRFLILQTMTSQDLSPEKFIFVPLQDFSRSWIDKDLYDKYDLSEEEIHFIESTIKPME